MRPPVLKQLEQELEAAGYKPRTEPFQRAMRARKVDLCQQAQKVDSCWDCQAFDHCELVKQYLRDIRTPLRKKPPA